MIESITRLCSRAGTLPEKISHFSGKILKRFKRLYFNVLML